MDEVHEKVLRKNRVFLVKEIILDELWDHLEAQEIFNNQMLETIKVADSHRLTVLNITLAVFLLF